MITIRLESRFVEVFMQLGQSIRENYPKVPEIDEIIEHAIDGQCYDGKGGWVTPKKRSKTRLDNRTEIKRCVQKSFAALGCLFSKNLLSKYNLENVSYSVYSNYRGKIVKTRGSKIQCNNHEFKKEKIGKDTIELLNRINEKILEMDQNICSVTVMRNFYAPETFYSDKEYMLEAIKRDTWTEGRAVMANLKLHDNSDLSLLHNKEFMLEAIKINIELLKYANKELKKDSSFMLKAASIHPQAIKYCDKSIRMNPEFIYDFCKLHDWTLFLLPKEVIDTKVLEIALNKNGLQLKNLKEYEQYGRIPDWLVRIALKQNIAALEFVSPKLLTEDEFFINCIKDKDFTIDQKKEILALIKDKKAGLYLKLMHEIEPFKEVVEDKLHEEILLKPSSKEQKQKVITETNELLSKISQRKEKIEKFEEKKEGHEEIISKSQDRLKTIDGKLRELSKNPKVDKQKLGGLQAKLSDLEKELLTAEKDRLEEIDNMITSLIREVDVIKRSAK